MAAQVTCSVDTLLHLLKVAQIHGDCMLWKMLPTTEAYPLMWPSATKDPIIPVESTSDSHLRSMEDEARRCWDGALEDVSKKRSWLGLLGVHDCVRDRLISPFQGVEATLVTVDVKNLLASCMDCTDCPDLRVIGARLTRQYLAQRGGWPVERLFSVPEAEVIATYRSTKKRWEIYHRGEPSGEETDEHLGEMLMQMPGWAT